MVEISLFDEGSGRPPEARAEVKGIVLSGPLKSIYNELKSRGFKPDEITGHSPESQKQIHAIIASPYKAPDSQQRYDSRALVNARVLCSSKDINALSCIYCGLTGIKGVYPEKIGTSEATKCNRYPLVALSYKSNEMQFKPVAEPRNRRNRWLPRSAMV